MIKLIMQSTLRTVAVSSLTMAILISPAFAGKNLLKDPGFERYHLDKEKGYFVPDKNAAWEETGYGRGSVRFDASKWRAPEDMTQELRLGFSPGAAGFEGPDADQNSGWIELRQDLIDPEAFFSGPKYEAWIWLGGAGKDNEGEVGDHKDESGGWIATFYPIDNPSEWNDETALQTHESNLDFYGEPGSFVRVSGYGAMPQGTKGVRFTVIAATRRRPGAADPGEYDTHAALDNAHFAVLDQPNLLVNGDFEMDETFGEFKGWKRPADYPFPTQGFRFRSGVKSPATKRFKLVRVDNVYNNHNYKNWDQNFNHGKFLPFLGQKRSYGYVTNRCGWMDDAFSFSQTVDYQYPAETPLTLMCNWIQDTKVRNAPWQLRNQGGELEFVLQYFKDERRREISHETFFARWPSPSDPVNRCMNDQNSRRAYNPRFRAVPPAGTNRIGFNVNVMVHCKPGEGMSHVAFAVDDFWFGAAK